jgi:hypothetical protein
MEVGMQLNHSQIQKGLMLTTLLCFAEWLFCLLPGFAQVTPPLNFSDEAEAARLQSIASQVLHLKLGPKPTLRSEGNMIGFRSDTVLISRRLDSRTYLVQDLRTNQGKVPPFKGTDQELLQYTRRIFSGLSIPVAEIAQARVMREQEQVAHLNRDTEKIEYGRVQAGRRWANLSRQVDGIPIFSSRAVVELDGENQLHFMELHWPVIPPETLNEAKRLAYKVKAGWRPPEMEGATVESSDAGILHSPALALVMDIYPVIRVIYRPLKPGLGKKSVRYLDRNGHDVPMPRQFPESLPPPREKRQVGPESEQK